MTGGAKREMGLENNSEKIVEGDEREETDRDERTG